MKKNIMTLSLREKTKCLLEEKRKEGIQRETEYDKKYERQVVWRGYISSLDDEVSENVVKTHFMTALSIALLVVTLFLLLPEKEEVALCFSIIIVIASPWISTIFLYDKERSKIVTITDKSIVVHESDKEEIEINFNEINRVIFYSDIENENSFYQISTEKCLNSMILSFPSKEAVRNIRMAMHNNKIQIVTKAINKEKVANEFNM